MTPDSLKKTVRRDQVVAIATLGVTSVLPVPSIVIVFSLAGNFSEFAEATTEWFCNGSAGTKATTGSGSWQAGPSAASFTASSERRWAFSCCSGACWW